MIANIIEESYQNKNRNKKKIDIHYEGPKEPFHDMEVEKLNNSTSINWKVKKTEKRINKDIDELLIFTFIDDNNNRSSAIENLNFHRAKTPTVHIIKQKAKPSKYLFKGDMSISDKINKTKIKEFSFSINAKNKNNKKRPYSLFRKESRNKNINRNNIKNILSPFRPMSANHSLNPNKYYNISNSDCFFITKLPNYYKNTNSIIRSKEKKLKKMKKLIKETNSTMLDIYTGLKNMKQNKFSAYDDPLSRNEKVNLKKGFKNTDKLNLGIKKSQSRSYINRKFKKLFQNIFDNKKYSNEKLDARTLLDPLDKITGGSYKEVKLDNAINNQIGQRIWIKKTTANIVSYGKSFLLLSDDIFYKERKRIIGIYPKIAKEAEILIPRKKIEKRHPLIKKIQENIKKIHDVYVNEYNLVDRVKKKYG